MPPGSGDGDPGGSGPGSGVGVVLEKGFPDPLVDIKGCPAFQEATSEPVRIK